MLVPLNVLPRFQELYRALLIVKLEEVRTPNAAV